MVEGERRGRKEGKGEKEGRKEERKDCVGGVVKILSMYRSLDKRSMWQNRKIKETYIIEVRNE